MWQTRASNEELETTNEELQSTNEELETTNEELQSTNEELETTVEELQAANAELAALNSELEDRGAELARLDSYHRGVVNSMEQGLFVVDRAGIVRTWNHVAERMWGVRAEQVLGREFFTLPIGDVVRRTRPAFEQMLATSQMQQVEAVPYTVPGGAKRHARVRIVPVTDTAVAIVAGVVIAWPEDGRAE
jgi:two-component system, chemotaxis family, CheB/CheR fusion protein